MGLCGLDYLCKSMCAHLCAPVCWGWRLGAVCRACGGDRSWSLPLSVALAQPCCCWVCITAQGAGVGEDTPRGPAVAEGERATRDIHILRTGGSGGSQACGHRDMTEKWRKDGRHR